MKVDQVRDKCNTREECLWNLCVLVIAWRDACFRGYVAKAKAWIIYMNTHFSSFVMYIWTWARKKISIFWPGNLNKPSWSSGMAERQVRQSYREALVQISPTTEKKNGKRKRGALERVVGEWEGKKEKERCRWKRDRNWNPLLLTQ